MALRVVTQEVIREVIRVRMSLVIPVLILLPIREVIQVRTNQVIPALTLLPIQEPIKEHMSLDMLERTPFKEISLMTIILKMEEKIPERQAVRAQAAARAVLLLRLRILL